MLILSLTGFLLDCSGGQQSREVVVSVNPLKLLVQEMDTSVQVVLAVGRNANPHIFDPSPRLVERMNRACALIYINTNFEQWVRGLDTRVKVELAPDVRNPHVWFDPVFMKEKVDKISATLSGCGYSPSVDEVKARIEDIDSIIRVQKKEIRKKIVLAHPSMKPLMDRYGIPVYSILFGQSGADLIPSEMRKVLALPPDSVIIFKESIFPDEDFQVFTSRGYKLAQFDPFGFDEKTYTGFIRHIWNLIYENAR